MNNLKSCSCSCLLCPSKYTDISISSTPLYADILHVLLKDCLLNLSEIEITEETVLHTKLWELILPLGVFVGV